jgi:hypothetical protein
MKRLHYDKYAKEYQKKYKFDKPLKYDWICYQVDTSSQKYRILIGASYAADNTLLASDNKPSEWEIPIPETVGEGLYLLGEKIIRIAGGK